MLWAKLYRFVRTVNPPLFWPNKLDIWLAEKNDYFDITIELLKKTSYDQLHNTIPSMLTSCPHRLPEIQAYIDTMERLVAESISYCEIVTFLLVMEKVYLG
jgi:hypothetical protein